MNSKSRARATLISALTMAIAATGIWAAHAANGEREIAGTQDIQGDASVSAAELTGAIDALFDDTGTLGQTHAVVVMHGGEIIAERYAPGFGPDTKQLSWSMAKSVTAVLTGLMVLDGRLALDSPVPLPAWRQTGDPRGAITLRQLLTMSSGIAHNEDNGPIARTDTAQMLFTGGSQDMAGFAEAKPLEQRPGSAFNYSSATSVIISDLIASRLTTSTDPQVRRDAMATFVRERLAKPGGMPSLTPEYDARGTMIGGSIMHMTARDYARFGELLRNKGRANGRQIVPERWISLMTTPSKANAGYGLHIWLNAQAPGNALFGGGGPPGIFGCVGHNGQYILVSPSQRLTVVRLGVSTTEQRVPLRAELLKLIRMFPG